MPEITRPPVVTILGHVDHGKTTILDYIRKTSVAAKEYGGITQAIGAYQAEAEGKKITFIDTPGHAAFEKMRLRGAGAADIAVLVVAADDGMMPQTVEAIKHIQSANVPLIVAVNKIDLPGIDVKAQTEKIKRQLNDQKVLVEEYGGDVPIVQISAKTGQGVTDLLETINLMTEVNDLKGDFDKKARGVILEARMDKFRGPVATVLIRDGSLKKGDILKSGKITGKIRGMFDFTGKAVEVAGPSQPVEVLGFETVPEVGSKVGETEEGKKEDETVRKMKIAGLIDKLRSDEKMLLNVVIKADNRGSLEVIEDLVNKLNQEEEHIKVIGSGTGDILESDVKIAEVVKAIVIGFNVKATATAQKMAETAHVLIRTYNIIYELMEELKDVVAGILQPGEVEEVFGRAQIIAEFPFGKNERIAGCKVLEGTFSKGPKVRIIRADPSTSPSTISSGPNGSGQKVVEETKIKSLKKAREEVNKVEKGDECGMMFNQPSDFQIGDIVESFRLL